jgi:hypothetical protein
MATKDITSRNRQGLIQRMTRTRAKNLLSSSLYCILGEEVTVVVMGRIHIFMLNFNCVGALWVVAWKKFGTLYHTYKKWGQNKTNVVGTKIRFCPLRPNNFFSIDESRKKILIFLKTLCLFGNSIGIP